MNKANEEVVWFLNFGCSNYMCRKKEYLSNIDESYKDYVKWGNNFTMVVIGIGNIRLNMNGVTHIVTGFIFAPQFIYQRLAE